MEELHCHVQPTIAQRGQQMSVRFTEIILNELKHGGFVESHRGSDGGYVLSRDIEDLAVSEILEFVEGPISVAPDAIKKDVGNEVCLGDEAFSYFWVDVNRAMRKVCDEMTFAELVEYEKIKRAQGAPNYYI